VVSPTDWPKSGEIRHHFDDSGTVLSVIEAVIWDFGGVILTSPFEAFARYEREIGLPDGFIRKVNATNPDDNAWAQLERNEVDVAGFGLLFESEARAISDHDAVTKISGEHVIALLAGEVRPQMVEALRRCRAAGLPIACLTNNIQTPGDGPGGSERSKQISEVMSLFDHVVESSKIGVRKPEPGAYLATCELLGVEPAACVFLDDLGINLKPARALGMTTIKVVDPDDALDELSAVLGITLRG
jgi:putative hydrolase of the HAD superfamily